MYNSAEAVYGSEVAGVLLNSQYQTSGNSVSVDAEGNILQVLRVYDDLML